MQFMYICIYVHVYVCMYVRVCVCVCVCLAALEFHMVYIYLLLSIVQFVVQGNTNERIKMIKGNVKPNKNCYEIHVQYT